ncbi:MAG: hypothetical protein R3Y43_04995 [Alphaproteobacteria bacterium]
MQDFWWVFALLCSIVSAGQVLYNQVFKFDSLIVTIYRGFGVALLLLPFAFMLKPISNPYFYILCIIQGTVIGYFDYHIFEASRRFGAGITGLAQPLTLMITFVAWLIISPETATLLFENKIKMSIIVLSLTSISACIYFLQNNKDNKKALKYLLLPMICVVLIDVVGKKVMSLGADDVVSAIYYYAFITAIFAGLANVIIFIKQKRNFKEIVTKNNLIKIGVPIAIIVISTNILKMYSVFLAFNPAYVGALLYSSPIWIMIFNKYFAKKLKSQKYISPNKWIVITIVISAILLVVASK